METELFQIDEREQKWYDIVLEESNILTLQSCYNDMRFSEISLVLPLENDSKIPAISKEERKALGMKVKPSASETKVDEKQQATERSGRPKSAPKLTQISDYGSLMSLEFPGNNRSHVPIINSDILLPDKIPTPDKIGESDDEEFDISPRKLPECLLGFDGYRESPAPPVSPEEMVAAEGYHYKVCSPELDDVVYKRETPYGTSLQGDIWSEFAEDVVSVKPCTPPVSNDSHLVQKLEQINEYVNTETDPIVGAHDFGSYETPQINRSGSWKHLVCGEDVAIGNDELQVFEVDTPLVEAIYTTQDNTYLDAEGRILSSPALKAKDFGSEESRIGDRVHTPEAFENDFEEDNISDIELLSPVERGGMTETKDIGSGNRRGSATPNDGSSNMHRPTRDGQNRGIIERLSKVLTTSINEKNASDTDIRGRSTTPLNGTSFMSSFPCVTFNPLNGAAFQLSAWDGPERSSKLLPIKTERSTSSVGSSKSAMSSASGETVASASLTNSVHSLTSKRSSDSLIGIDADSTSDGKIGMSEEIVYDGYTRPTNVRNSVSMDVGTGGSDVQSRKIISKSQIEELSSDYRDSRLRRSKEKPRYPQKEEIDIFGQQQRALEGYELRSRIEFCDDINRRERLGDGSEGPQNDHVLDEKLLVKGEKGEHIVADLKLNMNENSKRKKAKHVENDENKPMKVKKKREGKGPRDSPRHDLPKMEKKMIDTCSDIKLHHIPRTPESPKRGKPEHTSGCGPDRDRVCLPSIFNPVERRDSDSNVKESHRYTPSSASKYEKKGHFLPSITRK